MTCRSPLLAMMKSVCMHDAREFVHESSSRESSRAARSSSEATCSARLRERRYSSAFSRSFFRPSLPAFYPAHPCGTANVSQGLPGTRTVTKWNGRKNEWKTIKEESRGLERRSAQGTAEDQRWWWWKKVEEKRRKKRKVDHLAA